MARLGGELDALIAAGVDGLYTNGTAGEFHTQSEAEFDAIHALVAERCHGCGAALPDRRQPHERADSRSTASAGPKQLQPSAFQVILADWFPLKEAEMIACLARLAAAADPDRAGARTIRPMPRCVLTPAQIGRLHAAVPALIGVKVADGDAAWYAEMRAHCQGVAVFVPGHHLATGIANGAAGAYSNVACLSPAGSQRWYRPDAASICRRRWKWSSASGVYGRAHRALHRARRLRQSGAGQAAGGHRRLGRGGHAAALALPLDRPGRGRTPAPDRPIDAAGAISIVHHAGCRYSGVPRPTQRNHHARTERFWITGLVPATFTPFNADGSLKLALVEPMVEQLIGDGVTGLYVCGSTGEGISLTREERMATTAAFVAATRGRIPIVVQVGHNSIAEARLLAAHAQEVGADAISATPPSYFKPPTLAALIDCMAEIAAAAPELPFYYYHIPGMTGVTPNIAALLREGKPRIPTLVGVKFSHTAVFDMQAALAVEDGRYNLLFGSDEMLLSGLCGGAHGAVGSTYNFAAPLFNRIIDGVRGRRHADRPAPAGARPSKW